MKYFRYNIEFLGHKIRFDINYLHYYYYLFIAFFFFSSTDKNARKRI